MAEGKFEQVSWEQFGELVKQLIQQIRININCRGVPYGAIVGISTGGLVPTAVVANCLGIKPFIVGVKYYKDVNLRMETPQIFEHMTSSVHGKHVLLVDDVADTGKTLEVVSNYLYSKGAICVTMATLHYKPTSTVTPHVYVVTTDKWVVYPWEK